MDIITLLKQLDVSTLGILWAKFTGGWKGLAVYICKALTKLLKKIPQAELAKYAKLVAQIAQLVKMIVNEFVPEKYREAGAKTADAIADLAEHMSDGEYTEDEFDMDIDNVEACIDAWKKAK